VNGVVRLRVFSHRLRPVHLGPFPLERLKRAWGSAEIDAAQSRQLASDPPPAASGLAAPLVDYIRLFDSHRDGPVAPARAPIPADSVTRANNLKASCYFLDASMAAICAIPAALRGSQGQVCPADHGFALVILVEYGRQPAPGQPGADWIRGTKAAQAALRAAEIAVVMAGYIRRLGFAARAHSATTSELDLDRLVVAAGLGEGDGSGEGPANPYLGRRFGVAAVSTAMPLAVDLPLARRNLWDRIRAHGPAWWLGLGGTRPGWRRLADDLRPLHLGRYPMEKIKRCEAPTTLITSAIQRVPKRANFFTRARQGDLGDKAKRERQRFATKHPFAHAMTPLLQGMVPLQNGPIAAEPAGTGDPAANADAVKALAHYLGADMVGICAVPDFAWYSHHDDGAPIEPYHKYAIVMLIDQGFETMEGSSGDDWISGAQSMRSYLRGAEMAGVLAQHLRSLGHGARAQTNLDSDVLHIPLILLAGLGELSRIGELVLNPFVGPRFKSVVVTTDLPLAADKPIDFGLQDFCAKCVKCARECPCDAIPLGDKVMFNGYEIWKPDVEKCTRYRVTNPKGSACGRCMKTCPYNTEGLLAHRLFLWAAIYLPFTRQKIAILDDKVGNGKRNPVKKWWFDLEMIDGVSVTAKGVNARDLNLAAILRPQDQKIAHFSGDLMPPPSQQEPCPVDRAKGLQRAQAAQSPAAARRIHG
jgi:reductive dehalogenase